MEIVIGHLYPKNLNLYGDSGNIIILSKRALLRDIKIKVIELNIGDKHKENKIDLYFMGGGQDSDQINVVDDFYDLKRESLISDIENFSIFLGVCGGYQLMGNSFLMGDGASTRGLQILDVDTIAPSKKVKTRCIGNLIVELDPVIQEDMMKMYTNKLKEVVPKTLVGFENHSGQTYIKNEIIKPLANTIKGFGNNSEGIFEGARLKNIFGSYMHGPILSKNPHFADYLIYLAIRNKYKDNSFQLEPLDDSCEYQAHKFVISRYGK